MRVVRWLCCTITLSSVVFGSLQSSTNSRLADCSKQLVSYPDRKKLQHPVFTFDATSSNGGRLLYVGSRHSIDPKAPEFGEFEKAWNDFKPTMAFFEGSGHSVEATRDESIVKDGEAGLVRFLAARDKVPATSLEPKRQDEVNYLLTKFSAEQVKLFYVLRVIQEDRVIYKRSEAELRAELGPILDRFSRFKGLDAVVRNGAEFERAYERYWNSSPNWWEAPSAWFDPRVSSSQTGGVFTNEVNQESSSFRDINMYTVLVKATLEGNRVFAIVGRDHIPMQELALRCALK